MDIAIDTLKSIRYLKERQYEKVYHTKKMDAIQAKLARVALDLKFTEAAKLCDAAVETIRRIEIADRTVKQKTLDKVRAAYEKAGIEFIAENGGGPGVRLRKAKRKGK